jgi:transcriptional regulator GlxA family with amidase domain
MALPPTKLVGILIFDGVEILDFCGPFEVFCRAQNDSAEGDAPPPFKVLLIAERLEPIEAFGGMRVLPTHTLADHPALDILLTPGGPGIRQLLEHQPVLGWVRSAAASAELVCSVCTGALLLAAAGLLDGKRATTHWGSLDLLRERHPEVTGVGDQRVVQDGNIVTAAGVTAGIDLALHVVAQYCGQKSAEATARMIEYPGAGR